MIYDIEDATFVFECPECKRVSRISFAPATKEVGRRCPECFVNTQCIGIEIEDELPVPTEVQEK